MIEGQEYPIKITFKEAGPFEIMKNIGQGVFQLKLPKEWTIYNIFNKDLLIWYKELQFKEQHIGLALLLNIINKEEEYEVEEV